MPNKPGNLAGGSTGADVHHDLASGPLETNKIAPRNKQQPGSLATSSHKNHLEDLGEMPGELQRLPKNARLAGPGDFPRMPKKRDDSW